MAEKKDRISELPADILDNILGLLPIQEAARTAILSSFWKDIWFSMTKLNFDHGFFKYIFLKYSDAEGGESESPCFDVINRILMRHNGPIKKIVFTFCEDEFEFHYSGKLEDVVNLLSYNLNQWFLLLTQNGVEEIHLSSFILARCRVPNCIFSCPTLKRLKLSNVCVELRNAYCVLPNVTSISFLLVAFEEFEPTNRPNFVVYLPMLEDLSFIECDNGIFYFNIVAPKLGSLKIELLDCACYYLKEVGVLSPKLDLRSISSLDLNCSTCCFEVFIEGLTRVGQPLALNVEHLQLSIFDFRSLNYINNSAFINLLRSLKLNPEDFVLMKELSSVALTQKMLRTLKFGHCTGFGFEVQSIKALLACFQGIEKVGIAQDWIGNDIMQELLHFPRVSTKAEIFYIK